MIKIAGLILSIIALIFWVRSRLSVLKTPLSKVQSIPTGVRRPTMIMIVAFSILGPAILIFGGRQLGEELQREKNWQKTSGIVSHLEDAGIHKGRQQHRVAFQFKDQNGIAQSALSTERFTSPPEPGHEIAIHYNPQNPSEANLSNPVPRFLIPTGLTIMGFIFFSFAIMAGREVLRLNALKPLTSPNPLKPIRKIEGRLIKSKKNIFLSLKHQSCWQLHVEYHDQAGRRFNAISEPLWERNPEAWGNNTIPVPILVDGTHPSHAWVLVQDYFKLCQQQLHVSI